jgi:hypothetical protein
MASFWEHPEYYFAASIDVKENLLPARFIIVHKKRVTQEKRDELPIAVHSIGDVPGSDSLLVLS